LSAILKDERIGGQRLILGDCREIVGGLEYDAICTDPPYGIGITKSNRLSTSRGFGDDEDWDNEPADMAWAAACGLPAIIWGGNYFDLPPTRAPLVWDKNNAGRDFADFEMAWTNIDMVARRFVMRPMNMDGGKLHPTQKPLPLLKKLISIFTDEGDIVIDPCAGSGSSVVAALEMKRKAYGFEIKKDFYRDAKKWVDTVIQREKDIKKYGYSKTEIDNQSVNLFTHVE
jgi:site-specific DNA-methyltransferase (adenine-specific)